MHFSSRQKYLLFALLPALPFVWLAIHDFVFLHRGWHSDSHRISAAIWLIFCLVTPILAWTGPWFRERNRASSMIVAHAGGFIAYAILHLLVAYFFCSLLPLNDERPWNLFQTIRHESLQPGLLIFATTLLGGHWWSAKTPPQKLPGIITIKSGRKTVVIDWTTVCSVVAHGQYVKLFTNGKFELLTSSLRSLEAQMPSGFVRIHRSCIVNTSSIRQTRSLMNGDYELTLSNGQVVRASRTYREALRAILGPF